MVRNHAFLREVSAGPGSSGSSQGTGQFRIWEDLPQAFRQRHDVARRKLQPASADNLGKPSDVGGDNYATPHHLLHGYHSRGFFHERWQYDSHGIRDCSFESSALQCPHEFDVVAQPKGPGQYREPRPFGAIAYDSQAKLDVLRGQHRSRMQQHRKTFLAGEPSDEREQWRAGFQAAAGNWFRAREL